MNCPKCGEPIPLNTIMSEIGKKGTGKSKSRGDKEYYINMAKLSAIVRKNKKIKAMTQNDTPHDQSQSIPTAPESF